MRILLWLVLAFFLGVPLLSCSLYLLENLRAGQLGALRRDMGGLARPLARAVLSSFTELVLLVLTYPLAWLPARRPGDGQPVVLVHGLYHNDAAWFLFRRRLARAGLTNIRPFHYNSFLRTAPELVYELVGHILQVAADNPGRRVALVGHSLGGILLRAAVCDERLAGRPACLVTLGSPHQGSTLAGLALGRLGRSLRPGSGLFERLERLCEPLDLPRLALTTPTDNMVLPASGLLPPDTGWIVRRVRPMAHVALLYHPEPARLTLEFLRAHPG